MAPTSKALNTTRKMAYTRLLSKRLRQQSRGDYYIWRPSLRSWPYCVHLSDPTTVTLGSGRVHLPFRDPNTVPERERERAQRHLQTRSKWKGRNGEGRRTLKNTRSVHSRASCTVPIACGCSCHRRVRLANSACRQRRATVQFEKREKGKKRISVCACVQKWLNDASSWY